MKKLSFIKEVLLPVAFVTAIFMISSCGYNQKQPDTKDVAEERNDETFDNNKQKNDAEFLVNAAENNLEQIQLAQLAQQKGRTTQVKELGRMMEDAHTKSQRDLTALARSKSVTIPTTATNDVQDAYKDLNEKSDNDFDKAYTDLMVRKHKDAISDFEKASTDSNDSEIKNWATTSLPDMRKHLDHSLDFQKNYNKTEAKLNN